LLELYHIVTAANQLTQPTSHPKQADRQSRAEEGVVVALGREKTKKGSRIEMRA